MTSVNLTFDVAGMKAKKKWLIIFSMVPKFVYLMSFSESPKKSARHVRSWGPPVRLTLIQLASLQGIFFPAPKLNGAFKTHVILVFCSVF